MTETPEMQSRRLAAQIADYWAAKGRTVTTWVEQVRPAPDDREPLYVVRSDLEGQPGGVPGMEK